MISPISIRSRTFGIATMALIGLLVLISARGAFAADLVNESFMNLWPGKPPGAQGDMPADIPAVQVFLPDAAKKTGASIVVCPGGGYGMLAPHEGAVVGKFLVEHGVTAFVLRYRLGPKYHHPVELGDAQRAIRFVRSQAEEWKLDPKRIGIMGFSAGGHLASSASTHFTAGDAKSEDPIERVSSRPDIQTLIYPVISFGPKGHMGSRNNLLGKDPPTELVELLSNEKQVTKETPPAFLVHSTTDKGVLVENSDMYADALKAAGVEYEYVRADIGGHGFGLTDKWTPQWVAWLKKMKFAE